MSGVTTASTSMPDPLQLSEHRYKANQVISGYQLISSFSDGDFYYYYLYLGDVEYVPISWSPTYQYVGIPIELSFSTSTITTNSIRQSESVCASNSISVSNTLSAQFSISGGKKDVFEVGLTLGWENTKERVSQYSTTETYESATEWSETNTSSSSFVIDQRFSQGYYRYTLFSQCDVFCVLIYDVEEDEYYKEYIVNARENTYFYGLDFSTSPNFARSFQDSISLDDSLLEDLDVPTETLELPNDVIVFTDYQISLDPRSCAKDNGYDTDDTEDDDLAKNEIDPDLVKLLITNAYAMDDDGYIFGPDFGLHLKLIQDPNDVTVTHYSGSTVQNAQISIDTAKSASGTTINSQIKSGAVYLLLTYSDGTTQEHFEVNIFEGLTNNSTIHLLDDISVDDNKEIESIQITVVYEIVANWQGFLGIWSTTHTNWRIDYTVHRNGD